MKNSSLAAFNSHARPLNYTDQSILEAFFPTKWVTLGRHECASEKPGSHLWYKHNNSHISTNARKRHMLISSFALALMLISLLLLLSHESEPGFREKMARLGAQAVCACDWSERFLWSCEFVVNRN